MSLSDAFNDTMTVMAAGGNAPLFCAIRDKDTAMVRALLENGAPLVVRNTAGEVIFNAIFAAVDTDAPGPVFDILSEHGAMRHANLVTTGGLNALHLAARKGLESVVERLVRCGADPNARSDMGQTALHIAASAGHTHVIDALAALGADIAKAGPDIHGWYPAHGAAAMGQQLSLERLAHHGCDLCARADNAEGYLPIHLAATEKKAHVCRYLAAFGGINKKTRVTRETPLMLAARSKDIATVQALLECKADPLAVNAGRMTAHAIARQADVMSDVVPVLQRAQEEAIIARYAEINRARRL